MQPRERVLFPQSGKFSWSLTLGGRRLRARQWRPGRSSQLSGLGEGPIQDHPTKGLWYPQMCTVVWDLLQSIDDILSLSK